MHPSSPDWRILCLQSGCKKKTHSWVVCTRLRMWIEIMHDGYALHWFTYYMREADIKMAYKWGHLHKFFTRNKWMEIWWTRLSSFLIQTTVLNQKGNVSNLAHLLGSVTRSLMSFGHLGWTQLTRPVLDQDTVDSAKAWSNLSEKKNKHYIYFYYNILSDESWIFLAGQECLWIILTQLQAHLLGKGKRISIRSFDKIWPTENLFNQ